MLQEIKIDNSIKRLEILDTFCCLYCCRHQIAVYYEYEVEKEKNATKTVFLNYFTGCRYKHWWSMYFTVLNSGLQWRSVGCLTMNMSRNAQSTIVILESSSEFSKLCNTTNFFKKNSHKRYGCCDCRLTWWSETRFAILMSIS